MAKHKKLVIKDVSGFTGSFNLAAKNVAIADAMPDDATGSNGRLYVNCGIRFEILFGCPF